MPDPSPSSGNPATFASFLGALTRRGREPVESWDTTALADDVATISYEQALRKHRRVAAADPFAPSIESESPAPFAPAETKKSSRTASITIRLTEDEQARLHARAKEAGLSISAYLRSCIFEAESLRTQVKQALSQMREASAHEPHAGEEKQTPPSAQRRFRLFRRWTHRLDR